MSDAPIERFFEMYAERYMASDADAIAAMYEVPFLAVRESRAIHLGDRDAVRDLARTTVPSPTEEAAILVTA